MRRGRCGLDVRVPRRAGAAAPRRPASRRSWPPVAAGEQRSVAAEVVDDTPAVRSVRERGPGRHERRDAGRRGAAAPAPGHPARRGPHLPVAYAGEAAARWLCGTSPNGSTGSSNCCTAPRTTRSPAAQRLVRLDPLAQACAASRPTTRSTWPCFRRPGRFQQINGTFGHHAGDRCCGRPRTAAERDDAADLTARLHATSSRRVQGRNASTPPLWRSASGAAGRPIQVGAQQLAYGRVGIAVSSRPRRRRRCCASPTTHVHRKRNSPPGRRRNRHWRSSTSKPVAVRSAALLHFPRNAG